MAYFPNGSAGAAFEEEFCSRCIHSDYREGKDLGDHDNPACPVWMGHLLFAYQLCNETEHPGKILLDMLIPEPEVGRPRCSMFFPRDAGAAIAGQQAMEVFG